MEDNQKYPKYTSGIVFYSENVGDYSCYICMNQPQKSWIEHLRSEEHRLSFEYYTRSFDDNGQQIRCKLCENLVDCKIVIDHAASHKVIPWFKPLEEYEILFKNDISKWENLYYCHLCQVNFPSWFLAISHTASAKHQALQSLRKNAIKLIESSILLPYEVLSNHCIFEKNSDALSCFICNCTVQVSHPHILKHIESKTHVQSKKLFMEQLQSAENPHANFNPIKNDSAHCNTNRKSGKKDSGQSMKTELNIGTKLSQEHKLDMSSTSVSGEDIIFVRCNICELELWADQRNITRHSESESHRTRKFMLLAKSETVELDDIDLFSSKNPKSQYFMVGTSSDSHKNTAQVLKVITDEIDKNSSAVISPLIVGLSDEQFLCHLCNVVGRLNTIDEHVNTESHIKLIIAVKEVRSELKIGVDKMSLRPEKILFAVKLPKSGGEDRTVVVGDEGNPIDREPTSEVFIPNTITSIFGPEVNKQRGDEMDFVRCIICDAYLLRVKESMTFHIETVRHNISKEKWLQAWKSIPTQLFLYENDCDFRFYLTGNHLINGKILPLREVSKAEINTHNGQIIFWCSVCSYQTYNINSAREHRTHQKIFPGKGYRYVSTSKLPEAVKHLLNDPEQRITTILETVEQRTARNKYNEETVRVDLEKISRTQYSQAVAYNFSSRALGLADDTSYLDIFLDCGTENCSTYYGNNSTDTEVNERLETIKNCLSSDPQVWCIQNVFAHRTIPIINVKHIPTNIVCDICFTNGLPVEKTRLIQMYLDKYPNARKLVIFITHWVAHCGYGSYGIRTNKITWLVIYFLQTKSILPSISDLIKMNKKSKIIGSWETGVAVNFEPRPSNETFQQLLGQFFKFYGLFDYEGEVMCPLLGRALKKWQIRSTNLLPSEMKSYKNYLQETSNAKALATDTPMCLQDPFNLSRNVMKGLQKPFVDKYRIFCFYSATILNGY